MRNYKLVMPGDLNHYGFLFGGNLLKWVDEVSWIAACNDFPGCHFVTIGMDHVEFRKSVRDGTILIVDALLTKHGRTSVGYGVEVFRKRLETGDEEKVFTTTVTLVRVDEAGRKISLPPIAGKPETGDDSGLREKRES